MAGVPFIFGNATTSIPLSNLDANFNTGVTIGNTTVGLGNTVTTLGNVILNNVTINSGLLSTATIPTATGTVMVSGNMPAFSAYQSSTQTVANSTFTKVSLQTKEFDTNNNFDSTTNYRFTPTVSGYYQVSGQCNPGSNTGLIIVTVYKNGSRFKDLNLPNVGATGGGTGGSALIYFNGTTDYVELYVYQTTGLSTTTTAATNATYFQAVMVRAA